MGCGTEDKTITYVRKSIRTNKNRRKQWKTHRKCVTLASMQSKCRNTHGTKTIHRLSQKYIYLGHLQTWVPPHPPRVWKIGILQAMSRNSIIPDIDRDNYLASRKNPGKSSQLSLSPNIPCKRHTYYHGRKDAYHSRHWH